MIEINTKFKFFTENFILIFLFFIISCQPIEILDKVIFENNKLAKINLNSKTKIINQIYEANFAEPYIDHSLEFSPSFRFKSWVESNINAVGNENIIEINILNASITKKEIANENAKKYEEKYVFLYELKYSVEYQLTDNIGNILSNTTANIKRSTTSGKFISIMEKEKIIDLLILDSLIDISKKSSELISFHMSEFIL